MIKMAVMPIYGKNELKFISGTERPMTLKFDIQHWFYLIYSNDDPSLTMTCFTTSQLWTLKLLYGKKAKQCVFSSSELKCFR